MKHRALQKTWQDATGNLVPEGHTGACVLVARAGQALTAAELSRFPNAHEFFDGLKAAAVPEVVDPFGDEDTEIELESDQPEPQKAGKRKK